jgi:hypothetical protein
MSGGEYYAHLSVDQQEKLLLDLTERMYDAMDFLAAIQAGRLALMNTMKGDHHERNSTTTN